MGRTVLLLVMGTIVLISVLVLNINANTTRGLTSTLEYYDNTQSRLIANSGIEIYLEKLRRDKTLSGYFPENSVLGGNYNIDISGPDSALRIESVGEYDDVTHKCVVTAKRKAMKLPPINSALYVSSTNLNLDLAGNIDINGNDHNMDGTAGSSTAVPGIGVNNASDSSYVVNDLQPKISSAIQGSGSSPSVRSIPDTTNWNEVTQDYIFAADITLPTGTYTTGTVLGTKSEPKITYVNGDVHFSGDAYGYGILVVNGNFVLSGNFTFYGIVIVYGQSQIVTQTTGNSGIYGASIFVGESVDFKASGNAQFYYSNQAIQNAKLNLKSSRFEITSWWE